MDNPNYTERMINEALKVHTDLPITVGWDGNWPERDETANFEIYFDRNEVDLVVWDHGNTFDIYRRTGPSHYSAVDYASRYDKLALKIIEIIKEELTSTELGEEA